MCFCVNVKVGSHANAIAVPIPPHMEAYRRARIAAGLSPLIGLDRCIAEEVQYLWSLGIVTYGSCCGHNKDEATIIVASDDHQNMLGLGYQKSADGPWFVARGVATDSAEGTRG